MSPVLATRVKQIAAGVLDVGYADGGPADGPAVVQLHGWPYDIHTGRFPCAANGPGAAETNQRSGSAASTASAQA